MSYSAVLRSEWIKIRSLRTTFGLLLAVAALSAVLSGVVGALLGTSEADEPGFDPLFSGFIGITFGQIAAIAFGTAALSGEFRNGGLRTSLTAVPRRGTFYAGKMATVGCAALAAGLVGGFATLFAGQAFMGRYAVGLGDPGALRAAVGSGIYLALMALLAAGLTVVLRSGVAVLSLLIPFILIVSFVIGDMASTAADLLPDRAGQLVVHQYPEASFGPWTGLSVTAGWAAAAVLAGWLALRRRDA